MKAVDINEFYYFSIDKFSFKLILIILYNLIHFNQQKKRKKRKKVLGKDLSILAQNER